MNTYTSSQLKRINELKKIPDLFSYEVLKELEIYMFVGYIKTVIGFYPFEAVI